MDGILNVYKEKGKTSHDIVAIMRRLLGIKCIGHTGTLDPNAEGVLPICIGKGTKTSDMLTNTDKAYRAEVLLGVTTDSQDITGSVLETKEVSATKEGIISTCNSFLGKQKQIPPMYSAIKIEGKKLYTLARQGITIERTPRDIEIFDISVGEIDEQNHRFWVDISCSKGTYIRTICSDIGERLGCGATLLSLIRTKSGMFDIENSLTIEEITALVQNEEIADKLMPVDSVFSEYERFVVDEADEKKILNGVSPKMDIDDLGKLYRVYNNSGRFLCISRIEERDGNMILKLQKSFYG